MKWTRPKLKRALMKLIQDPVLVIQERPLKYNAALCSWETGERVIISVDMHRDSMMSSVIHELLHVVFEKTFTDFNDDLEEDIISGFERRMFEHIQASPKQMLWWRTHINRKLRKEKSHG